MKKLLVLLFSFFLLSSPSVFADDISDFEIEGISIGDSLLDYMTEEEIIEWIEITKDDYSYLKKPNKYAEVYLTMNEFSTYNHVSVFIKNNSVNQYVTNKNEKYTILSIRGLSRYIEDLDGCLQKRDEILEILSKMLQDTPMSPEGTTTHPLDPSGDSIIDAVNFYLDSGDSARAHCSDWEENFRIKNNYSEGLSVEIRSEEIRRWLND
jgi:hypothetical protein